MFMTIMPQKYPKIFSFSVAMATVLTVFKIFFSYDSPYIAGHFDVPYDIVGYNLRYEKAQKHQKTRKNADLGNFGRFHGNNKIFRGLTEKVKLEDNTSSNLIAKIRKIPQSNFAAPKVA